MNSDWVLQPLTQYGFLGLSAVLLALVVWLIKRLLAVLDANTRVIELCGASHNSIYADHRIMWTGVLNWPPVSPESLLGNTVVPHNHGCRL